MQAQEETIPRSQPSLWLVFILFVCAAIALWLGWVTAVWALSDGPDTCFTLSMGRWITAHHAFPASDPFSNNVGDFGRVSPGGPLIQYQWLPEILLYRCVQLFGATGLRVLTMLMVALTFVVLPFRTLSAAKTPNLLILLAVALGLSASQFRFYCRPEMFSYLLLSFAIFIAFRLDDTESAGRRNCMFGLLVMTMVLWANCHVLFPLGLIFLLIKTICTVGQRYLLKESNGQKLQREIVALVLCTAATMVNPWGFGLWQYVIRLSHSSVYSVVPENGGIALADLIKHPLAILPGVLFALVPLIVIARAWVKGGWKSTGALAPVLVAGLIAMSVAHFKLLPFSVLFGLAAIAEVMRRRTDFAKGETMFGGWFASAAPNLVNWLKELQNVCARDLRLNSWRWTGGTVLSLCLITGFTSAWTMRQDIPQDTQYNFVPRQIFDLLDHRRPAGVMLNYAPFGGDMYWLMKHPPPVFIDDRWHVYDPQLVFDYYTMMYCYPRWQQLLEAYRINWVLMPPDEPLVKALKSGSAWKIFAQDDFAVVMIRIPEGSAKDHG